MTSIALALAGRAGARLAGVLGLSAAKDTLLRLVRAAPEEPVGQIRVLGVDDFALRKGDSRTPRSWWTCRGGDRWTCCPAGTPNHWPHG
ncbi:hypothetical protein GCM10010495_75860 [Kitasatospora herbaricolor]|nr:hypothetical protein GCM10010495_75860 [Kitasatospora herbaricolor]